MNTTDIQLKEYEQNMATYRYLADMNVKYIMFFIIISGVILKIYFDAQDTMLIFLIFLMVIGSYVSWSITQVYKRMTSLAKDIKSLELSLGMLGQDFDPFLKFLKATIAVIIISTLLTVTGMYFHIKSTDIQTKEVDIITPTKTPKG